MPLQSAQFSSKLMSRGQELSSTPEGMDVFLEDDRRRSPRRFARGERFEPERGVSRRVG